MNGSLQTKAPGSYTHLYVYKRQVDKPRRKSSRATRLTAAGHFWRMSGWGSTPSVSTGAVSYTHLDVYKRQGGRFREFLVRRLRHDARVTLEVGVHEGRQDLPSLRDGRLPSRDVVLGPLNEGLDALIRRQRVGGAGLQADQSGACLLYTSRCV